MTMKGLLLALIVLLALIRDVRSDLPVHCLTSDVAGIWRFCLDRDRDVQLPRCGSDTPNTNLGNLRLSNYSSWLEANRGGVGECITVQLTTDEAADGTSGREDWKRLVVRDGDRTSGDIGRWTMVYDEGFEVRLDNGRVLFAFSHYAPTSEANCPPPHNGQGEDNHGRTQCYVSHCHRTQIGWHSDASEYGCFVGSKLSSRTPRPPRTTNYVRHIAPSADSTQPDNEGDANTPTTTTTAIDTGVCASRRPIFVRYHHHPPTDDVIPSSSAVRFAGKPGRRLTIGSVLRRSGGVSFLQSRALFASNFPCPLAATSTPPTTETRGGQHELPASFSWEGELGRDDVINQQDCGSCYAIACAYALQSRFRIELSRRGVRDVPVQLSAQSVLSCSPYNQGCDGGYPFLVGKHASEVCLQEEKCLGYAATHTSVACPTSHTPLSDDCRSLWFAKSYSYVGGFYEHSSEDRIKAEVFHRGPVVIAINAPKALSEYRQTSAVFDRPPSLAEDGGNYGVCDVDKKGWNGWQYTDHAVVVVGWGETTPAAHTNSSSCHKYWIVRNSWGPQWGDSGYFKMCRGKNLAGVESQAVVIDPELTRGRAAQILAERGLAETNSSSSTEQARGTTRQVSIGSRGQIN